MFWIASHCNRPYVYHFHINTYNHTTKTGRPACSEYISLFDFFPSHYMQSKMIGNRKYIFWSSRRYHLSAVFDLLFSIEEETKFCTWWQNNLPDLKKIIKNYKKWKHMLFLPKEKWMLETATKYEHLWEEYTQNEMIFTFIHLFTCTQRGWRMMLRSCVSSSSSSGEELTCLGAVHCVWDTCRWHCSIGIGNSIFAEKEKETECAILCLLSSHSRMQTARFPSIHHIRGHLTLSLPYIQSELYVHRQK